MNYKYIFFILLINIIFFGCDNSPNMDEFISDSNNNNENEALKRDMEGDYDIDLYLSEKNSSFDEKQIKKISKSYSSNELVYNYTAYIETGEIHAVYAPSSYFQTGYQYIALITPISGDPDLYLYTYDGYNFRYIRKSIKADLQQDESFIEYSDLLNGDSYVYYIINGYQGGKYTFNLYKHSNIDASKPLESKYIIDNNNSLSFNAGSSTLGRHKGIDYLTSNQNPYVYAICDGTIKLINTDRSDYTSDYRKYWNAFIIIEHECSGQNFYAYYGHLENSQSLKINNRVTKGQKIGKIRDAYKCTTVNNSGECLSGSDDNSNKDRSNNHLHFGINDNYKSYGWGRANGWSEEQVINDGWYNPTTFFNW